MGVIRVTVLSDYIIKSFDGFLNYKTNHFDIGQVEAELVVTEDLCCRYS